MKVPKKLGATTALGGLVAVLETLEKLPADRAPYYLGLIGLFVVCHTVTDCVHAVCRKREE